MTVSTKNPDRKSDVRALGMVLATLPKYVCQQTHETVVVRYDLIYDHILFAGSNALRSPRRRVRNGIAIFHLKQ